MTGDMFDKFGYDVSFMIIHAKAASLTAKINCLYPESFAIGIIVTGKNDVTRPLLDQKVNLENCLKDLKSLLNKKAQKKSEEYAGDGIENFAISKQSIEICEIAHSLSEKMKAETVGLHHMFLSIIQKCPQIRDVFVENGTDINKFLEEIKSHKKNKRSPRKNSNQNAPALEVFCVNMTEKAANNEYDPIISREEEIEEAITILCRRNKNNPILVGEPGVGKTAVVEGICQRIISQTVPKKLRQAEVYSLNMGSLIAGTKYRGEFEQRLNAIIEDLQEDPNKFLFIDEIHNIIGAGAASGSVDAANLLKPELAKGLSCIGATTNSEYKQIFKEDGALDRRFEKVEIEEPSKEQTLTILWGVKSRFEEFHDCVITDDAVETAVELTDRYCHTKHFPDKAIDVIDTACARFAWEDKADRVITGSDVAVVVSKKSQVPLEIILRDNYERINNIEKTLKSKVMGQDHVIDAVCRTLKNAYSGVRDPERPIGSFVFGGETGTGKTYTCNQLAMALFGKTSSFIRLDMSEYSEKHSISKIIGSPPGYVGFKEVDIVADKIKRKPYCVLLVDEIDKAHPEVLKLFLQVMSNGFFTDAQGEKVDCRNIILIMTGNFGLHDKESVSIGFTEASSKKQIDKHKERVIEYCKSAYGEEFVNRIDDFLAFSPLTEEDLRSIALLRLTEFVNMVSKKDIDITVDSDILDTIIEKSSIEHGRNANSINRILSKHIRPLMADKILEAESDKERTHKIILTAKDGEFITRVRRRKK
tara:strand:+ start:2176 stop:4455 length:2280 start_codon:yes stop_codon:yes gene_type:complete